MIYLTTGANGAGKTLLTLKDVREQQLKENRPVYYHGFDLDPEKALEFGWKEFDPRKWQDLPDGSICIMDECQNEFPIRRSGSEVPDYINAIAQHRRRRGFDFWMITPHPSLIDVFVRRLIDKPSWHRHLKRAFGADMVSVLTFSSPDLKCEEPGAGARGEVAMRAFPKEVYKWYASASLHTGKKRVPKAVYFLIAAAIAIPATLYLGVSGVYANATSKAKPGLITAPVNPEAVMTKAGPERPGLNADTLPEYLAHRKPRIPDFPHTAPVYDSVVQPVSAPYPAACIQMGKVCKCYTQQATVMPVSGAVCVQIVKNGFFVDWKQETQMQPQQLAQLSRPVQSEPPKPPPVSVELRLPEKHQPGLSNSWQESLDRWNSQVRSSLPDRRGLRDRS